MQKTIMAMFFLGSFYVASAQDEASTASMQSGQVDYVFLERQIKAKEAQFVREKMCHLICRAVAARSAWNSIPDFPVVPLVKLIIIKGSLEGGATISERGDTLYIDPVLFFSLNAAEIEALNIHESAHAIWVVLPESFKDSVTTWWFSTEKFRLSSVAEGKRKDSASTPVGKELGHPQSNENELFATVFTRIVMGWVDGVPPGIFTMIRPYAEPFAVLYKQNTFCNMWGR